MNSVETTSKILEQVVEHCQHLTSMPLGFLEVDDGVFECPSDSNELLSALTKQFSTDELVKAGVVVGKEGETVAVSPALTGGECFVVLRDADTNQPYDLLTEAGCLAADALPVIEILRDGCTRRFLGEGNGELFVACELKQVIMLRACGLPATLSVGLGDFPLEQLDTFCEAFGITRFKSDRTVDREGLDAGSSDQSESDSVDPVRHMMSNMGNDGDDIVEQLKPYATLNPALTSTKPPAAQLVFVGWTPTELSKAVPCQLKAVVDYLVQLQQFLQVDILDIALWEIDDETIERLQFIANHRNTAFFIDNLLDATEFIGDSIVQFGKEKPLAISPPRDYPTALARLYESASPGDKRRLPGPNHRDQAKRDVHQFLDQQIIGPMREFAMATNNPIERNMLMGFTELSHIFHLKTIAMGEQLVRGGNDRDVEGRGQLLEDDLKTLLSTADRLIGMAKATKTCNLTPVTVIDSRMTNSTNTRRLPPSV